MNKQEWNVFCHISLCIQRCGWSLSCLWCQAVQKERQRVLTSLFQDQVLITSEFRLYFLTDMHKQAALSSTSIPTVLLPDVCHVYSSSCIPVPLHVYSGGKYIFPLLQFPDLYSQNTIQQLLIELVCKAIWTVLWIKKIKKNSLDSFPLISQIRLQSTLVVLWIAKESFILVDSFLWIGRFISQSEWVFCESLKNHSFYSSLFNESIESICKTAGCK